MTRLADTLVLEWALRRPFDRLAQLAILEHDALRAGRDGTHDLAQVLAALVPAAELLGFARTEATGALTRAHEAGRRQRTDLGDGKVLP